MVSVESIERSEIEEVRRLHNQFTGQAVSVETMRSWFEDAPELFVGAYDDGEIVGVCVGRRHDADHAELAGLGVVPSFRREGVGTRLVAAFEAAAVAVGIDSVSVGSAGGYVDEFYTENGYEPESVLVRSAPGDLPDDYRDQEYDVVEETTDGETKKRYVDADGRDPGFLDAVRDAFGDEDAIYIMRKSLTDE